MSSFKITNVLFFQLQNHPRVCQISSHEDIRKLPLPSGIPQTVEELEHIVQETSAIEQDFSVQFQDQEFDGQFFTLLETSDIKDKDTIKAVLAEPVITSVQDYSPDNLGSTAAYFVGCHDFFCEHMINPFSFGDFMTLL